MAKKSNPDDMSFLEHLEELRWRIVRSLIAVVVVATVAFLFKDFVFDTVILGPKRADFTTYKFFCWLGGNIGMKDTLCIDVDFELQNIVMAGQFTAHIMVSVVAGIIVAFPYILYQFWMFVSPGLRTGEKTASRGIIASCTALFLIGVLFGYYLISPLSVQFLGNYTVSDSVANQIALNSFISTVSTVTLACGLVFQLPVVIYFMARAGLVTDKDLKGYRKHAAVAVLVLSAIITPPDITSQILVSLPLVLLYEISIGIARVAGRKNKKALSR